MATGDLTTLANVKQWLNITSGNDDPVFNRLISAESQRIQTWLSRTIASASYSEVYDGKGTLSMPLANFPISAVSSLTIDGISIPAAPIPGPTAPAPSGYVFTPTMLSLVGGGYPFDAGYKFNRGYQNVAVSYTAGYSAVPLDVEQACIELISIRYRERDRIGHKSKSLAGEVVAFFTGDMPDSVKGMLQSYRRVTPR